jgi:Zn-dependent protease with chaperone function
VNFFERQRQVRRMSGRLVVLFVLAVIGIVVVVDLAVAWALDGFSMDTGGLITLLLVTSVITLAAISLAALFRMLGLRGGGGTVARELGGVLVAQDTTDPQLRRLRNVVEEIAIASGVPVPEVYLLPDEEGINAFAAGWSTSDAAVAVTRGALERLNRAELQGVIAHEFSHVVNGDMRLNIRLMGLLFGILFLSVIGRTLAQTGLIAGGNRSRDDRSNGNPLAIIGIVLLVAGFIGVVAGRFIKAAVSRQREYLADASAVQFTRQTSGLVGALAKIAGLESGSKLVSPKREEVGHMLFGAGGRLSSWFATHPPLIDRIKVLDPSFDPARLRQLSEQWAAHPPSGLQEDASLGFAEGGSGTGLGMPTGTTGPDLPTWPTGLGLPTEPGLPAPDGKVAVAEEGVVAGIAAPSEGAYVRAEALIGQIPADLLDRARDARTVVPLVLGLLASDEEGVSATQHSTLASKYGREIADAAWAQANALAGLHPLLRLPLAELAFPALRQRPAAERATIIDQVFTLIHADGRIDPYEYCLSRLVYGELTDSLHPRSGWRDGRHRLASTPDAAVALLSIVAQAGNTDPSAAERAFRAGAARVFPGQQVPFAPSAQGVTALETAWPKLVDLAAQDTQLLVAGVVAVISEDGVTTVTEMELLRTICAILHSPLPL